MSGADLFYVPIYPSTWLSGRSHDLTTRERTRSKLLKSIEWIRHMSPFWDRYQGADHIFTKFQKCTFFVLQLSTQSGKNI